MLFTSLLVYLLNQKLSQVNRFLLLLLDALFNFHNFILLFCLSIYFLIQHFLDIILMIEQKAFIISNIVDKLQLAVLLFVGTHFSGVLHLILVKISSVKCCYFISYNVFKRMKNMLTVKLLNQSMMTTGQQLNTSFTTQQLEISQ